MTLAPNNPRAEVSVGQTDAAALARTDRPLTADQWLDNVANRSNVGPPKRELVQVQGTNDPTIPFIPTDPESVKHRREEIIALEIDRDICAPKLGGAFLGLGVASIANVYQRSTGRPVGNLRANAGAIALAEGGSYVMDKVFFHDDTPATAQLDDLALTPLIAGRLGGSVWRKAGIALAVHFGFKLVDKLFQPNYVTDPRAEALSNVPTNKLNTWQNPITSTKDPPPNVAPLPKGVFPYAQFGPQERAIQDDNRLRQFYHMPLGRVPQAGDKPLQLPPGMIPGDKSVAPPNTQSGPPIDQSKLPQPGDDAASILKKYGFQLK
jgi:hypothetical protein